MPSITFEDSTVPADSGKALEELDLVACDGEPIHRPGAVQPQGVLVALTDPDLVVAFASENAATIFNVTAAEMLGRRFAGFLREGDAEALRRIEGLGVWRASVVTTLGIPGPGGESEVDCRVSRSEDLWIVEFEPALGQKSGIFQRVFIPIRDALWQLDAFHDLHVYAQRVVDQVRLLTGFDRVMLYRFEEDWDGEVIAESRGVGIESYLGHRFPAGDVPAQARQLYSRNLIRTIADIDAEPVSVLRWEGYREAEALDMTHSALRQLSPVHIEYLRNMGVRASMSISLLQDQRLWGLIACHHRQPKRIPFLIQEMDEFIGKTVSLKLSSMAQQARVAYAERVRNLVAQLTSEIRASHDPMSVAALYQAELLEIMRATGAVVVINGKRLFLGDTMPEDALLALESWLLAEQSGVTFETRDLKAHFPAAASYAESVCGLLFAPVDQMMGGYIMWFRGSVTQMVKWGGNPRKTLEPEGDHVRVSPRKSFKTWMEYHRQACPPWTSIEMDAARSISLAIIDVLSQSALRESLRKYRLVTDHSNDLVACLDLKGTLTFVSPASRRLFGMQAEDITGTLLHDYVHPEDRATLSAALESFSDTSLNPEVVIRLGEQFAGASTWIEASFSLYGDSSTGEVGMVMNARDVSQRYSYQLAIEDLHRRNTVILESAGEGIVSIDPKGYVTFANERAANILGALTTDLPGGYVPDVLGPVDQSGAEQSPCPILIALAGGTPTNGQLGYFRHKTQATVPVQYMCTPIVRDEQVVGSIIVFNEQSEYQRINEQLRTRDAILNESAEAVMVSDAALVLVAVNRAFTEITGFEAHEAIGRTTKLLKSGVHTPNFYESMWRQLSQENRWAGEIWNKRKNGEIYPQWGSITAILNAAGEIVHYVAVFSDISKAKQTEEKLFYLANHDLLTGLPNRSHFTDRISNAISRAKRRPARLALLFIDLDHFKLVNDSLGHDFGDTFLREVSKRLVRVVRRQETMARWGGDEFIVLLEDIPADIDVTLAVRRILAAICEPMSIEGHELVPGASIGVATYPENADNAADLIKCADMAMYRAKQEGRNRIEFYNANFAEEIRQRCEVGADLQWALRNGELGLLFQPVFDAETQRVSGLEALLRWTNPKRGVLTPATFIPVAEELGIAGELGEWVLTETCRQIAEWKREGVACPRVSINVSPRQLDARFPAKVADVLNRFQVHPKSLGVEIGEVSLESQTETARILRSLRDLGITVSIDDFGTGNSSLAHIKHFPISCLKIDKSFIDGIPVNLQDTAIVRAIIALGESMSVPVVAEGVESIGQFEVLKRLGASHVQGNLFGRPMPARDIVSLLG